MPINVPPTRAGATNNNPDSYFISEIRRILRDQPVIFGDSLPTDGVTGALTAGSKPFRLQRAPIWTGTGNVLVNLTAANVVYPVDFDVPSYIPVAGRVNIVTDTGEVIFLTAPITGTLSITYQAVRFSDQQISDALYEGLSMLWPEIWNPTTDTTSIFVSPTQYEYPLPSIFQDQRVVLLEVEYAPPSGVVRYFKTSLWRLITDYLNPILVFQRIPPVASTVRLTYTQPLANGALGSALGQVPVIAQHLPVYYALSRLMMDQETMRGRSDDQPAQTGESANPTGSALSTSSYWFQQYTEQLTKMSMTEPMRRSVTSRAVERLGLSELWTNSA
jgi:hypothetical protein